MIRSLIYIIPISWVIFSFLEHHKLQAQAQAPTPRTENVHSFVIRIDGIPQKQACYSKVHSARIRSILNNSCDSNAWSLEHCRHTQMVPPITAEDPQCSLCLRHKDAQEDSRHVSYTRRDDFDHRLETILDSCHCSPTLHILLVTFFKKIIQMFSIREGFGKARRNFHSVQAE